MEVDAVSDNGSEDDDAATIGFTSGSASDRASSCAQYTNRQRRGRWSHPSSFGSSVLRLCTSTKLIAAALRPAVPRGSTSCPRNEPCSPLTPRLLVAGMRQHHRRDMGHQLLIVQLNATISGARCPSPIILISHGCARTRCSPCPSHGCSHVTSPNKPTINPHRHAVHVCA